MNKSYILLTLLSISGLNATQAPQSTYRTPGASNGVHEEHCDHSDHCNQRGATSHSRTSSSQRRPTTVYNRNITKQDCDHNRELIAQASDDVALAQIIEDIDTMHGAEEAADFTCNICNEYNIRSLLARVQAVDGFVWSGERFCNTPCYNAVQNLKEAAARNYQQ